MAKDGSSTEAEPLLQSFDGTQGSDTEAEPCLPDANGEHATHGCKSLVVE